MERNHPGDTAAGAAAPTPPRAVVVVIGPQCSGRSTAAVHLAALAPKTTAVVDHSAYASTMTAVKPAASPADASPAALPSLHRMCKDVARIASNRAFSSVSSTTGAPMPESANGVITTTQSTGDIAGSAVGAVRRDAHQDRPSCAVVPPPSLVVIDAPHTTATPSSRQALARALRASCGPDTILHCVALKPTAAAAQWMEGRAAFDRFAGADPIAPSARLPPQPRLAVPLTGPGHDKDETQAPSHVAAAVASSAAALPFVSPAATGAPTLAEGWDALETLPVTIDPATTMGDTACLLLPGEVLNFCLSASDERAAGDYPGDQWSDAASAVLAAARAWGRGRTGDVSGLAAGAPGRCIVIANLCGAVATTGARGREAATPTKGWGVHRHPNLYDRGDRVLHPDSRPSDAADATARHRRDYMSQLATATLCPVVQVAIAAGGGGTGCGNSPHVLEFGYVNAAAASAAPQGGPSVAVDAVAMAFLQAAFALDMRTSCVLHMDLPDSAADAEQRRAAAIFARSNGLGLWHVSPPLGGCVPFETIAFSSPCTTHATTHTDARSACAGTPSPSGDPLAAAALARRETLILQFRQKQAATARAVKDARGDTSGAEGGPVSVPTVTVPLGTWRRLSMTLEADMPFRSTELDVARVSPQVDPLFVRPPAAQLVDASGFEGGAASGLASGTAQLGGGGGGVVAAHTTSTSANSDVIISGVGAPMFDAATGLPLHLLTAGLSAASRRAARAPAVENETGGGGGRRRVAHAVGADGRPIDPRSSLPLPARPMTPYFAFCRDARRNAVPPDVVSGDNSTVPHFDSAAHRGAAAASRFLADAWRSSGAAVRAHYETEFSDGMARYRVECRTFVEQGGDPAALRGPPRRKAVTADDARSAAAKRCAAARAPPATAASRQPAGDAAEQANAMNAPTKAEDAFYVGDDGEWHCVWDEPGSSTSAADDASGDDGDAMAPPVRMKAELGDGARRRPRDGDGNINAALQARTLPRLATSTGLGGRSSRTLGGPTAATMDPLYFTPRGESDEDW